MLSGDRTVRLAAHSTIVRTPKVNAYIQTILRNTGRLLHIPSVMALLTLPICLIFQEYGNILPFLLTSGVAFAVGQLLFRLFRRRTDVYLREAMLIVAISWAAIPLVSALPFVLIASQSEPPLTPLSLLDFQNPLNAIFESMSGFTSTGLSMATSPSNLPHSLQWWRSFMEWVGGVGIAILILSILEPTIDEDKLYSAEGRSKKIGDTIKGTVQRIWKIYLLYTALGILLLRVAGMPWWDSINHAMAAIATGGFSIKDDSIGSYSPLIQLAVIPIMIAGAISFYTHYYFLRRRRLSALWIDTQHRFLWALLAAGTLILAVENYWFEGSFLWLDSVFQWVSALGTCGYNTVTIQDWSAVVKVWLCFALIVGAAAGSTVGGIKMSRLAALCKGVLWRFKRIVRQPQAPIRYRIDSQELSEQEANDRVRGASVLSLLWLAMLFLGTVILLHVVSPQYSTVDVFFEAASALGGVGLSTGITGPDLHWLGKVMLTVYMWMGRLEIIPVLILLSTLLQGFEPVKSTQE
ncbi:MAG: TrkH family potassium uptake protein [Cyanophyceae cyanobacterium]